MNSTNTDINIHLNEFIMLDTKGIVQLYSQGRSLDRQGAKKTKFAVAVCFESIEVSRDEGLIALAEYAKRVDEREGSNGEINALRTRIREVCKDRKEPILTVKRIEGKLAVTLAKEKQGVTNERTLEKAFKAIAEATGSNQCTDTLKEMANQNRGLIEALYNLINNG